MSATYEGEERRRRPNRHGYRNGKWYGPGNDERDDHDPTPYELDTSAPSGAETLERGMAEARRIKRGR